MALDAFDGVLTAQGIVQAARRRVGSPDLHLDLDGKETLDAPAYQELQMILDQLALSWDWPFARTVCTFTIGSGERSTTLPAHFWRIGFADPFYIVDADGARSRLVLQHPEQWHDFLNLPPDRLGPPNRSGGQTFGRPVRAWIRKDNGIGTIFLEPVPDVQYTIEAHFYPWQCPLEGIDDKPWFPYSAYLVSRLAMVLGIGQDDSRAEQEAALQQQLMKEIRSSISDQDSRGRAIPLNRQYFRTPIRL